MSLIRTATREASMKTLLAALIVVNALIPAGAMAGRDGADEMVMERARQRVIQERAQMRAFQACLAAAKTDAQTNQCREMLKHKN